MERIYELINPSDTISIMTEGESKELCDGIATAVAIIVGDGQISAKNEEGESEGIFFMYPNPQAEVDAYFNKGFQMDFKSFIKQHASAICKSLETTMCVDPEEYRGLIAAFDGLPDRAKRLQKYNDEKRSSLNDFCGYARDMAEAVRGKFIKGEVDEQKADIQQDAAAPHA